MKMLAVRNFFSTSHFYFFQQTQLGLFIFIYSFIVITFLIWYKSSCLNLIVVLVTVTSEDVCWSIRNVKFLNESFYNMRCVVMFITAVCLIFLLKLKWPKVSYVVHIVDISLLSRSFTSHASVNILKFKFHFHSGAPAR